MAIYDKISLNICDSLGTGNWRAPIFSSLGEKFASSPSLTSYTACPNLKNFGNKFNFNSSIWSSNIPIYTQTSTPVYWSNFSLPLFNFSMPSFNFSMFSFPRLGNFSFQSWESAAKNLSSSFTVSGNNIIPEGYNIAKGEKLGQTAWNHRNTKYRWRHGRLTNFTGWCAKYSKESIELAGLGKKEPANGWECYKLMDKNPNFKEIAVPKDYKKLPPGCVLLFKPGSQGYHKVYGHIEISLGNGKAVSDGVSNNMRKPDKVYIPV